MSVKAPLKWVLAAILCACTLTALWVTAARVKGQKMAARYGERIEEPPARLVPDEPGAAKISLRRNERRKVEHFTLQLLEDGALAVEDVRGVRLVEFRALRKNQLRRWQELELTFVDVAADAVAIETRLRPGSPCFGAGAYLALRVGLQVQFPGDRSFTVTGWDASKSELKLRCDGPSVHVENTFPLGGEGRLLSVHTRLERNAAGEARLLLEELD